MKYSVLWVFRLDRQKFCNHCIVTFLGLWNFQFKLRFHITHVPFLQVLLYKQVDVLRKSVSLIIPGIYKIVLRIYSWIVSLFETGKKNGDKNMKRCNISMCFRSFYLLFCIMWRFRIVSFHHVWFKRLIITVKMINIIYSSKIIRNKLNGHGFIGGCYSLGQRRKEYLNIDLRKFYGMV